MRRVFPSVEVCHLWAHQTQSDARNSTGSVFFEGPTIYSYGHHFPMARIYMRGFQKRDKGPVQRLVLMNCAKHSVTTAKHQFYVRRAVSHLLSVECPFAPDPAYAFDAKEKHAGNLAYFQAEIKTHLDKAKRAMQQRTVEWRLASAQGLHQNALDYSAFFGIRRQVPAFPAAAFEAATLRARRIEEPDPVKDAAKIRAQERAKVRERAALQAQFDAYCIEVTAWNAAVAVARAALPVETNPAQFWRNNGVWPAAWQIEVPHAVRPNIYGLSSRDRRRMARIFDMPHVASTYDRGDRDLPCMLRVSGDQIETSLGARIPLAHAGRIWALVQACRSTGREYKANGHTEHAGVYAIDSVAADGTLKAGCHSITYAELALLARTLNLTTDTGDANE